MNHLCRAVVSANDKSLFKEFELTTVREYVSEDRGVYLDEIKTASEFLDSSHAFDEPFYRIYGVYKNKTPKTRQLIRDFYRIHEAVSFLHDLTGEEVKLISY